jgi:YbbR domain-containing protein
MAGRRVRVLSLLRHNWKLKCMALLIATISWHVIQDAISFEVVIPEIRLQMQVREGMAILDQSVSTVDVTFRGSQEDIQRLDPRRLHALVNLEDETSPRPKEVVLSPDIVKGMRGARAVAVHPAQIHVTLDQQAEKRVPVQGRITGTPLSGEVGAVICEPSTVILRGPAAKLRTTESVYTQPVDVDGRVETFVRRSPLQAPGDNWVAQMEPAEVQVKVTVTRKVSVRQLKSVPVSAVVEPGQWVAIQVEPATVDVELTGKPGAVISPEDSRQVRVVADCVGLVAPGTFVVPVRVFAGNDVGAVATPETVRVVMTLK